MGFHFDRGLITNLRTPSRFRRHFRIETSTHIERVSISPAAVFPSALAEDMGIEPEITRVRGRSRQMVLVNVLARG